MCNRDTVSDLAERLASDLEVGAEIPLHRALSDREYQVMCLIASGKTVRESASQSLQAKFVVLGFFTGSPLPRD